MHFVQSKPDAELCLRSKTAIFDSDQLHWRQETRPNPNYFFREPHCKAGIDCETYNSHSRHIRPKILQLDDGNSTKIGRKHTIIGAKIEKKKLVPVSQ